MSRECFVAISQQQTGEGVVMQKVVVITWANLARWSKRYSIWNRQAL